MRFIIRLSAESFLSISIIQFTTRNKVYSVRKKYIVIGQNAKDVHKWFRYDMDFVDSMEHFFLEFQCITINHLSINFGLKTLKKGKVLKTQ